MPRLLILYFYGFLGAETAGLTEASLIGVLSPSTAPKLGEEGETSLTRIVLYCWNSLMGVWYTSLLVAVEEDLHGCCPDFSRFLNLLD